VTGLLALVALWAFAEAILFFIVADVPISYIAVRHGMRPALKAAFMAAGAAALGGCVLLVIASSDPELVRSLLVGLPAIDAAMVADSNRAFSVEAYGAMANGSFAGKPYKLYAYAAAPHAPGGMISFLAASFAARLPRFLLAACVPYLLSRLLGRWIDMRFRLIVLALFWVLFYGWYFAVMPG
jgi:hypothetical protein